MKIKLKTLLAAIEALRQDTAIWERPDLEVDLSVVEADLKENFVDMLRVTTEYTSQSGKTLPVYSHNVILEVFDTPDNQKPRLTHQTKTDIT